MRPSRHIAKKIRVWPYITTSTTLVIAINAPSDSSADAQLRPVPASRAADSGASEFSELVITEMGATPTAATATRMYRRVDRVNEPTMAIGRSLPGFRDSSEPVDTASK